MQKQNSKIIEVVKVRVTLKENKIIQGPDNVGVLPALDGEQRDRMAWQPRVDDDRTRTWVRTTQVRLDRIVP